MNIKLKHAREKMNLTQEEVANKICVAIRAYQNYEAGVRLPRVDTALRIANALNVDVKEIFSINK